MRRAAADAGLDRDGRRVRFHDLRHTFASHLIIDIRLDVVQVSRILGHARTSMTLDTYTHLFERRATAPMSVPSSPGATSRTCSRTGPSRASMPAKHLRSTEHRRTKRVAERREEGAATAPRSPCCYLTKT